VRITADTNLLVRALTDDDPEQSARAKAVLAAAELVALPTPMLCELVWVLTRNYRVPAPDICDALRRLLKSENVAYDRLAAEAGPAVLENGGDFADGVIARDGARLGGGIFMSFDREAIRLVKAHGIEAREP
jgi:predicted nucleic-acid-binding protein